jgi:hypothetical protein
MRRRASERLVFIGVGFAGLKCVAAKIFWPVQLLKKLIRRMPGNGHTPWALSPEWRV